MFKGQESSAGSYCCASGTRVPAVFVKVDERRLHFEVPYTYGAYGAWARTWATWAIDWTGENEYLQLGNWHRVEVRQYLIDSEVKRNF